MTSRLETKEPLCGRYPTELTRAAREYALAQRLSLNVVLTAALAEYLAKRKSGQHGPAPQLHYHKGHPPADLVMWQQALMKVDPRGRKIGRHDRRKWKPDGRHDASELATEVAKHAADGEPPRSASEDPALVRVGEPHPA
ncbi:MAG: hypothetical protein AABM40_04560 [Chloroflexota bacterium]